MASATRDGHQVLVVVLGSEDRYGDALTLLDYYFDNYAWHSLDIGSGPLNRFQDSGGAWRTFGLQDKAEVFLPRWQRVLLRPFRQVNGEGAVEASDPVGEYTILLHPGSPGSVLPVAQTPRRGVSTPAHPVRPDISRPPSSSWTDQ